LQICIFAFAGFEKRIAFCFISVYIISENIKILMPMDKNIDLGQFYVELTGIVIEKLTDENLAKLFDFIRKAVETLEKIALHQPAVMPLLQGYRSYYQKFLEEIDARNIQVLSVDLEEILKAAQERPQELEDAFKEVPFNNLLHFSNAIETLEADNLFRKMVLPFVTQELLRRTSRVPGSKEIN